jgi:hypothetical protein
VLAILDLLVLIAYFTSFYYFTLGIDATLMSRHTCKLFSYLFRITTQLTSWWQLVMTIDRTLMVKYPRRFKIFEKKRPLCALLACLFVTLTLVNIVNFLYDLVETTPLQSNSTNQTAAVTRACAAPSTALSLIRDFVSQLFRTIIPYLLMIVFNFVLIKTLIKSRKKFAKNDSLKKEYQFAFSLIAHNTVYLLVLSPVFISLLFVNFYRHILSTPATDGTMMAVNFFHNVTVNLALLNSALSLISNLVCNKMFRKEFLSLIRRVKHSICLNNNEPNVSIRESSISHKNSMKRKSTAKATS